jgi:DNA polymerase bacteriophage-type
MIWLDLETRSTADVTEVGPYIMAADPTLRIISVHYAFDGSPVLHWRGLFEVDPHPHDLWDRIRSGEEVAAWNAAFDRLIWNACASRTPGMPTITIEQIRDAASVARAHNLPASLAKASAAVLPIGQRKLAGRNYLNLWRHDTDLTDADRPSYEEMLAYGDRDVEAMREIVSYTCGWLPGLQEDYVVSERINDRGVGVDRKWAEKAVGLKYAAEEELEAELRVLTTEACSECRWITDGSVCKACGGTGETYAKTLRQSAVISAWVLRRLKAAGVSVPSEQFDKAKKRINADGTGYLTDIRKSFDKTVRAKLRTYLEEHADLPDVMRALDIIDEGSGAAASKYEAALRRSDDRGILRGMYILNGASQTGRYTSTGMQTHNLLRRVMPDPDEVIETLMHAAPKHARALCAERWGLPLHDVLGRLLRPTIVPRKGKAFVWADSSAIEARVCPWLSGKPSAETVLDLFRSGEDVYLAAASDIEGRPITDSDDPSRQLGKVAVLSLGFGGGAGAFSAMARNYGIPEMPTRQVRNIVYSWRDANPWARGWWDALALAAASALEIKSHGKVFVAGRVSFSFEAGLLGGTLIMHLPCGRHLFYPEAEVRKHSYDDSTPPEAVITYRHPMFGRAPLWYGQLAENATQATAASLLRRSLAMLEGDPGGVVAHTHDEIVMECAPEDAPRVAQAMQAVMSETPVWAEGLPLAADVKAGWAYYVSDPELLRPAHTRAAS